MCDSCKRKMFKNFGGCGGCGKAKPKDVLEPKPKAKNTTPYDQNPSNNLCPSSASSPWEIGGAYTSTTTFSFNVDTSSPHLSERENDPNCTKMASPLATKLVDSVAIVKDSDDPYQDFRQSMLQMILENEIYSKHDLQELLQCFLQLNSPCHHKMIIQAFMEIWNGCVSQSPASNSQSS